MHILFLIITSMIAITYNSNINQVQLAGQPHITGCQRNELSNLTFLEGNWSVKSRKRNADGNWEETTDRSKIEKDMSGCILIERYEGVRNGERYEAIGMMGIANISGKLQRIWADSEHGGFICYEGERAERVVRLDSQIELQGTKITLRHMYSNISENGFRLESQRSTDDGLSWMPVWRADYDRDH